MVDQNVDIKVDVKLKLSALWVTLVLIYLYADLFGFFLPDHLADFQITQELLLVFMILMTFPCLMVFLSLILKPKLNRLVNISVGIIQLVFVIAGILDPNLYFVFASSVEIILLLLIIWYSWTWPLQVD
jgi:hypothetical protein